MRVTNKMADNYNVYNLNKNKTLLDDLNNQMSTKKKFYEPMDNPVIAARSLHFRADLSEIEQFLEKNVTDAISWTDTTQTAIDTGKDILRSLKSEYTSAANGTNKNEDRWTYYNNMVNLVNEFYAVGNTTNENRYVFTGARTVDSFTFNAKNFDDRAKDIGTTATKDETTGRYKDIFKYVGITEDFQLNDLESYTFTSRSDKNLDLGGRMADSNSGITLEEIAAVNPLTRTAVDETKIQNVDVYRLRLSYENLDAAQNASDVPEAYRTEGTDEQKKYDLTKFGKLIVDGSADSPYEVTLIQNDYEVNQESFAGDDNKRVYLNTTTGNLIFGENIHTEIANALNNNKTVSFSYNKSEWAEDDVKPEHYFNCIDTSVPDDKDPILYNEHEQTIEYNVGDNQVLKVNTNANRVFSLDAVRDLNEIRNALKAVEDAEEKVNKLSEMKEDSLRYSEDELEDIGYLLAAAEKEFKYATEKLDKLYSNGMTRSQDYFDTANLAGTDMGTTVKRLTIIRNRLTENRTTITAQASENENIDITTTAVDVNAATLSYGAALQVTGKISQQSLVNFL